MSAHTYTLMCDLKVITTGVLSYMVLDRHLNRQAVVSLGVLFAGICIGQYATTATESSPKAAAAAAAAASGASELQQLLPGLLVMATIAMLSAVASVYTEWVMNFSSFRHESINLHNARMYVAGTLLNGLYYWQSGGSFGDFFAGMRSSHWAIVLMLAMMGLVTVSKGGNGGKGRGGEGGTRAGRSRGPSNKYVRMHSTRLCLTAAVWRQAGVR